MHYIVDGYNFLFRFKSANTSLESSRNELITLLDKLCGKLNLKATVIFDSNEEFAQAYAAKAILQYIEIVYSPLKKTADDYILEFIESVRYPQTFCVVSSDNGLCNYSKQLGAKTISIEDFVELINKKQTPSYTEKKPSSESSKEFDRLLKIFESRFKPN